MSTVGASYARKQGVWGELALTRTRVLRHHTRSYGALEGLPDDANQNATVLVLGDLGGGRAPPLRARGYLHG